MEALIERLQGTIEVESNLEKVLASRFVYLQHGGPLGSRTPYQSVDSHGRRDPIDQAQILLVEDNPQVRDVVQTMLESDSAAVVTANSGESLVLLHNSSV